jgi:hypothetical protein
MLVWIEGFESSRFTTKINANGTTCSGGSRNGSGRTGSQASQTAYAVRLAGTDVDDLIVTGHAVLSSTVAIGSETVILAFQGDFVSPSTWTEHVTVTWGTDGKIRVYRGTTAGTLLGTSAAAVMPLSATWYFVEAKVRLSDTVGTVEIRIDETPVLTLTGLDTKNGGTASVFSRVEFSTVGEVMDDIYLCNEQGSANADYLGPLRIEALRPDGNGATSNGVGSDGNSTDNYLLVNLDTTGDYVDLAATGDKDTYTHSDSAQPTANAVAGVFVWAYSDKTDAGSRSLVPVARLSGTEVDGTALALDNGTFKSRGVIFETKPGGGAWTVANINSAEFGVKAGA